MDSEEAYKEARKAMNTPDEHGRYRGYYDFGFGVNEAEKIRQELVIVLTLTTCDHCAGGALDVTSCPTHMEIWEKIERLAELAGATWYKEPPKASSPEGKPCP